MKKVLSILLRLLLGGAFLFSAYAKLFPIEPFEVLLLQQGIVSWEIAPFFSRALIASEAILGILIILGIYQKPVLKITILILLIFTVYILFILLKYGNEADCGCMGEIKLNPYESILKNVILFGLAACLLRFFTYDFRFYPVLVVIFIGLTFYPLPFILNPPDAYFADQLANPSPYPMNMALLEEIVIDGKKPDFKKDKYILAFLSLNCGHCKLAASRLELIKKEVKGLPPVYFIFAGKKARIPGFFEETKSSFPYYYMDDTQKFLKLTRGSFPTIVYLNNGRVEKKFSSFEINPESFEKAISGH